MSITVDRKKPDNQTDFYLGEGYDVWNCYDFSCLSNGQPSSYILKLLVPTECGKTFDVTALKQYLDGFANSNFSKTELHELLSRQLSKAVDDTVQVGLHSIDDLGNFELAKLPQGEVFSNLRFTSPIGKFVYGDVCVSGTLNIAYTNTLHRRDLFLRIANYITSLSAKSGTPENICEMILDFVVGTNYYAQVCVACLCTRSEGIDVNPFRFSTTSYPVVDYADVTKLSQRTLRQ